MKYTGSTNLTDSTSTEGGYSAERIYYYIVNKRKRFSEGIVKAFEEWDKEYELELLERKKRKQNMKEFIKSISKPWLAVIAVLVLISVLVLIEKVFSVDRVVLGIVVVGVLAYKWIEGKQKQDKADRARWEGSPAEKAADIEQRKADTAKTIQETRKLKIENDKAEKE